MVIDLSDNLSRKDLSRTEKTHLILNHKNNSAKSLNEIREIAKENELREIEKWNLSDLLLKSKGDVIKIKDGWILTSQGLSKLSDKKIVKSTHQLQTNTMT